MTTSLNPTIIPSDRLLQAGDIFAVYGTLRKGNGNYKYTGMRTGAKFLGEETVQGTLYHLGGFPGLTQEASPVPVTVEVYKLLDPALGVRLDRLEGYKPAKPEGSMYIRAKTVTNSGREAFIYYYNSLRVPARRVILSGDWHNRGEIGALEKAAS